MATPIGKSHRSLNHTLRKELGLNANVRPCLNFPEYKTRYDNVNLVPVRENTEREYSGLEHQVSVCLVYIHCLLVIPLMLLVIQSSYFWCQVVRGVVESLKIITRQASLRVAEYAFHYAKMNGRQRVSSIHKANIMRKTDGLFLKVYCCCRKPQIGKGISVSLTIFICSVAVRLQRSILISLMRKSLSTTAA